MTDRSKIECFFCDAATVTVLLDANRAQYQTACPVCYARGPFKSSENEAVIAWVGVATALASHKAILSAPPNWDKVPLTENAEDFEAIRADAHTQEKAALGRNEPRLSDAFGMIKELAQLLRDRGPS